MGGTTMAAHHHTTHEFWFVVQGEAVMQVADEAHTIKVGDLIYTKPGTPHRLRVESPETFRALAFALGYPGQGSQTSTSSWTPWNQPDPSGWPPRRGQPGLLIPLAPEKIPPLTIPERQPA
ncbi:cupin domain-containing protein [Actinacidiphila glaucinigra]|uniref:cupin domain-containing protein n=1 Tax=Actinacidiphila glaucinigra TaxID=235986 RepID=UPI0036CB2288